jgi:MFS transporter, PAT family, beta-lactamase induction signal transducer AmpG
VIVSKRDNPPWLFGFLAMCNGIYYWGFSALLIPYLLRKHGVPVNRIAEVVATASIPWVWFFFWCPLVDLGLRRRTWILLSSGLASLCGLTVVLESAGSLALVTSFLFAGNVALTLGYAATGALMSTLNPDMRGRASGWAQAGNVGGGSLAGGAAVWLADAARLPLLGTICAAAIFAPALAALLIVETRHPRLAVGPLFAALFRDVRDLLWSWRTLIGLAFFLSPVGAAAVGNLISGVGPDYHASGREVAWITGAAGGVFTGLGAALGGFVCNRINRMIAYSSAGLLAALCGAWLMLGPATPLTYGAGYAAYALSTGIAYTAFNALVLDVLGRRERGAATGYSVLTALGTLPVVYMTWLDGVGYKHLGSRGLMGVDAAANGAAGVVLLLVAVYCAKRRPHLYRVTI